MSQKLYQSMLFIRFGEIAIPLLTWIIITLPLWLSPFHPALVAYLIIAFDLFFFYKSLQTTIYSAITYKRILDNNKIAYDVMVKEIDNSKDLKHFIIIPNYKEPIYKLESTVQSIVDNDYPYKQFYLVLAFEKREEEGPQKADDLKKKYGEHFADVLVCYHELVAPEIPGKASNQTYAAKKVEEYVREKGWDFHDTILTICDADSHLAKNYFSYLTFAYLNDKERQYHFYWAPVLLYNNFWQLPFVVRLQATLSSIVRIAFVSQTEKLIHVSTYSTNLWLLQKINYWDVDIIPEDWHIYLQAFFAFGGKVRTLPLYTINNGDAVYSGSLWNTLLNRYEQEKRWAWGVTDIAYSWNRLFDTPHIPLFTKLKKIYQVAETHLLWPTSFFLLTVSASLVPLVNPLFKRTVLGFLLPQLSGVILTVSSSMLILYIYLDIKLRQQVKVGTKPINLPLLLVQWYFLPFVSFILSSLPALEAHTRLLMGKKITYKVTEKV